ncbi:uncharacterized protein LOC115764838 [Drosophila novamexicana]|uniref:uncharacterized protein LOC115764838 n=1 Tax=Drosophila novamexicana TaxID=47314 RepID=UPI0011E5D764|nr:uncharacterized protein LOC115764838 [Drosophila novamexicana]
MHVSLVQTAPLEIALMGIDRVDQIGYAAGTVSWAYPLADKREMVPELKLSLLQDRFQQDDVNIWQMHLMQLNLLKILVILDVMIFIFVCYVTCIN